ncbi:hypothetical protein W02_07160 [Nitrospira sp. KM1]|uniref:hypothetical protein n=1 Tax=Nitrospira sp. KM1 TaxID=1936990 RepID=UPI0013A74BEE|nr:hypothetical protein [Nitrospira sp. KM1]BCA53576.1 hypothetical protein W02_07160 [Nitrospira sp. KM1]
MIALVGQILTCLLVAAGIGLIMGWLLRQLSIDQLSQHIYDVTAALRDKEHALHDAQLELKANETSIEALESDLEEAQALAASQQHDLTSSAERVLKVQSDLAQASQRVAELEAERSASQQSDGERPDIMAAFEQEARLANAARSSARRELSLKEAEVIELHAKLEEAGIAIAKLERLKSQMSEMEPAQGRVHWLEVQLSEKEVQYRAGMNESERQRADLARRVSELEPLVQQVQDLTAANASWESRYTRAVKQHATDEGIIETQRGAIQDLQNSLTDRDTSIRKQSDQLAALQRQLNELQSLYDGLASQHEGKVQQAGAERQVRGREKPMRTALKGRAARDGVIPAQKSMKKDQLNLQIADSHVALESAAQKDDLKKIRGIDSMLEQALNELGTCTFIQIAKWTTSDITKVARHLETPADRIRRDNWIAEAKKQHRVKYGEQI